MLAHGTGMAPLVSIIERAAKEQDELRKITLIQGVRDEDEVFSRNALDQYFENSKQSKWVLACSRQTNEDGKCPLQLSGYVQDVLRAAGDINLDADQKLGDRLKTALATD